MVASALRSVPRITTTLDGALAVWREDKERMQEFLLGQGVGQ